jgi:hypothetical protein
MEILGHGNRRFGVVCKQRRHLERNPTIHATGPIVNRPEQVSGLRKVFQRQFEEQFLARFAFRELALDRAVVVAAVLDRVVENRRVGRNPVTDNSSM